MGGGVAYQDIGAMAVVNMPLGIGAAGESRSAESADGAGWQHFSSLNSNKVELEKPI